MVKLWTRPIKEAKKIAKLEQKIADNRFLLFSQLQVTCFDHAKHHACVLFFFLFFNSSLNRLVILLLVEITEISSFFNPVRVSSASDVGVNYPNSALFCKLSFSTLNPIRLMSNLTTKNTFKYLDRFEMFTVYDESLE